MRNHILGLTIASGSLFAQFGGVDMALLGKWQDARVIRYQIAAVHQARAQVVFGDYNGKADVIDKINAEFVWDVTEGKAIGEVKILEAKSELKNLKSDGTNCPPPMLQGEYEHFQMLKQTVGPGQQIQLDGVRVFPSASVSNYPASCSMRSIPGGKEKKVIWIAVMPPIVLAMPTNPGEKDRGVSPDKKSFWIKDSDGWTWTYTPIIVK